MLTKCQTVSFIMNSRDELAKTHTTGLPTKHLFHPIATLSKLTKAIKNQREHKSTHAYHSNRHIETDVLALLSLWQPPGANTWRTDIDHILMCNFQPGALWHFLRVLLRVYLNSINLFCLHTASLDHFPNPCKQDNNTSQTQKFNVRDHISQFDIG